WAYRDIRDRTRDVGLQVLAVFVVMLFFPGFNIPGLALYMMMRPRETLEEAYSRSLEEEALLREIGDEGLCPSCRRFVERAWRICPFCQTQLKDICGECEHLLSFNWVVCPYCTAERKLVLFRALQNIRKDRQPAGDNETAGACVQSRELKVWFVASDNNCRGVVAREISLPRVRADGRNDRAIERPHSAAIQVFRLR